MPNLNIERNTLGAVILFAIYVSAQDKIISDTEFESIKEKVNSIKYGNLDLFGSIERSDLRELITLSAKKINNTPSWLTKRFSKDERNYFKEILSEKYFIDMALIVARLCASSDGFHQREKHKYNLWLKEWPSNLS